MDYSYNIRQEVLTLARKIQTTPEKYPEVMLTTAKEYIDINEKRKNAIRSLYEDKRLRSIRKLYAEHGGYSSSLVSRRKAGNVIRIAYPKESNDFHKAKNYMYDNYTWKFCNVMEFLYMEKLLECKDIENINKYFRCVNAKRYDDSLIPVAFLRPIRQSVVIEILSFKILKELV